MAEQACCAVTMSRCSYGMKRVEDRHMDPRGVLETRTIREYF